MEPQALEVSKDAAEREVVWRKFLLFIVLLLYGWVFDEECKIRNSGRILPGWYPGVRCVCPTDKFVSGRQKIRCLVFQFVDTFYLRHH